MHALPEKEEFFGFESMAIIGAVAEDFSISITLQIPQSLVEFTLPTDLRNTDKERLLDWIGERANQLKGRFKNKLLNYHCEIAIDIPHVVHGQEMWVSIPKRSRFF
ncbi:MAG: chemotaxis protein CheX [bacterium]|nr:hypothetical protein [Gammaproteobacteria bacterium]HIL98633.1 hypothetical protein [Pseudomonadales bacterium]